MSSVRLVRVVVRREVWALSWAIWVWVWAVRSARERALGVFGW